MDWKFIGKMWLIGVMAFFAGSLLLGCGKKSWSPMDPRVAEPDTSNLKVEDSWNMEIETNVP